MHKSDFELPIWSLCSINIFAFFPPYLSLSLSSHTSIFIMHNLNKIKHKKSVHIKFRIGIQMPPASFSVGYLLPLPNSFVSIGANIFDTYWFCYCWCCSSSAIFIRIFKFGNWKPSTLVRKNIISFEWGKILFSRNQCKKLYKNRFI